MPNPTVGTLIAALQKHPLEMQLTFEYAEEGADYPEYVGNTFYLQKWDSLNTNESIVTIVIYEGEK